MNETISKGLKGCLLGLAAIILITTAFVAGYVSGNSLAVAPVAGQFEPVEEEQALPSTTPLPTVAPVTRVVTATPTEAGLEEVFPEPEFTPTSSPSQAADPLDLYWEVWSLIERDFYGELPTEQDRTYGAIRGALQKLDDDHTSFIEPEIAAINRSDMSGDFEGIGAYVRMDEANRVEIVGTIEEQPAEAAGIEAGDVVIAVDGESTEGMGLYEAIALIRGPKGTTVVLTIQRPGEREPFDVEIVRARIPLPTVKSEMLPDNVGYIRLYEFNGQATDRLQEAIEELLDQGPVGLILDLRNNPGGFLGQAVSVADEFLPAGVVLIERGNNWEDIFESTDEGMAEEIPLVVLINSGSASASEIVAGAIQDHGRAVLIGETSFGKGSVQQPHTLSNGAELRITIARWFTPNDHAIHGEGLEPDILVPFTEEDQENELDPQLERAVEYLITGE